MSDLSHSEIDKPWRIWAAAVVVFIVAFGALCGLIIIPVVQGRAAGIDAWTAICRAVGILPGSPAAQQPTSDAAAQPTTNVAWTVPIIARLTTRDPGKGAETGQICAACHGPQGISLDAQFPDIAGQSAFAIYKQLHDYKNGARINEQMMPVVQSLTDEQMADVAVHWSSQSTGAGDSRVARTGEEAIRNLVELGDVRRGLPACVSCHSANAGGPVETPTLVGQRSEYITAQLRHFRSGTRKNDIYRRMRSVAEKLTDGEIRDLGQYYSRVR